MENNIFTKIYNEYLTYVYRYLYGLTFNKHTAEDLTQDVFVRAFCFLDFPNEGIKSWLLTVAHNIYVDHIKKNKRLKYSSEDELSRFQVPDVQNTVIEKETTLIVLERLKDLPETQRQAVLLCLINELSYYEAANIMGVSVSAVTNLIYRARHTLRKLRRKEE